MTNLIIISSPEVIENEESMVNTLFDNGLELFHLRKPGYTETEICRYLEKIKPEYIEKVSIHQHHQVAEKFNIRYLHFKEANINEVENYSKLSGKLFSTSCHSLKDVENLPKIFDYCFLSPVFDSISKKGYLGKFDKDFSINTYQEKNVKGCVRHIFALGGINESNIKEVFERGFYGAALLGYIWEDTKESLKKFKNVKM